MKILKFGSAAIISNPSVKNVSIRVQHDYDHNSVEESKGYICIKLWDEGYRRSCDVIINPLTRRYNISSASSLNVKVDVD